MEWSAIITTYNSEHVIVRALRSLAALPCEEKPLDIIIVDNASSDNTIDIIRSCDIPVKIVCNQHNLGLSKANNIGAIHATGESLFFLNPDIEILPGAVTALHLFQEKHPHAAIIGPAMLDQDGLRQSTARTWPTPLVIASRRTFLQKTKWGKKLSYHHMNYFNSSNTPIKPHWLVGAAMWLTPNGKKVGLMSEKYFLYFEDVEWCWRTWQTSMEVWYEPNAKIRHVCQRESTSVSRVLGYHLKSMLQFMITHPAILLGIGSGGKK